MKKFKFILIGLIALTTLANAQFKSVTECGANGVGHSIFFINADTGFVVGEGNSFGLIQRTKDGGKTWINVYESKAKFEWMEDVSFVSPNIGVAVGWNASILRTVDGGTTWNRQIIPNVVRFTSVFFPTATIGYATGKGAPLAPIFKTTDAGLNWKAQISNADSILYSIYFVNADTGYAVGSSDVVKTTDGGTTWATIINNPPSLSDGEHGEIIFCTDANTCYMSKETSILKTINGGVKWNLLTLPSLSAPYIYYITAISFTNSLTGFAVGAKIDTVNSTMIGAILKTVDAGQTWKNINSTANNDTLNRIPLTSVKFINSQIGYTTAMKGKVLKTINGGGITTGIKTVNKKANEINIYPNPFSTQTILHSDKFLKNATIGVYNNLGQTIKLLINISGHTITLNRDNLPSGLYFMRITEENKVITIDKLLITD